MSKISVQSNENPDYQNEAKLNDINHWIGLIKEKSVVLDVDRDLLESLIEKIEVSDKKVVGDVTVQDVKIFYKYVGLQ